VDEEAIKADLSDIQDFIDGEEIKSIVYLVTSRSLSHLAMLQEKYYQVYIPISHQFLKLETLIMVCPIRLLLNQLSLPVLNDELF
jgi:hypothetical protein